MATSPIDLSGGFAQQPAPAAPGAIDLSGGFPSTPPAPAQATPAPTASVSAPPDHTLGEKLSNWSRNVTGDLKNGTDVTGVGAVLKAMGAHGLDAGVSPAVADFMGSLPLGLVRATQGAGEIATPGQKWQGTKDVVGGLLGASTIPGGFVAPGAGEMAGEVGDAALGKAGDVAAAVAKPAKAVAAAVRKPFSLQAVQDALTGSHADIQQSLATATKSIQDDWHSQVRNIFDRVAQDAGVTPDPSVSLHDIASNLSDVLRAKAHGLYQQADVAVGGTRFQGFQDAVRNIKKAIHEEVGIDPERDAHLQARLADAKAGHDLARESLAAKGVDPAIIDKADALHSKAMSLYDLSKPMQASMTGLRADLQGGANAASEALSPGKLALRANKLFDRGRLQNALGNDGSADLLTAIEDTKQRIQDVATGAKQQAEAAQSRYAVDKAKVQGRVTALKVGAASALGSVPGYELVKHLIGL